MHSAAVVVLAAEILPCRSLLIVGHVDGVLHKLIDALALSRRDSHNRDAEDALHVVETNRAAVARHLVHHVQGQHHRYAQFHQLDSEVEVALDVRCIDDVDKALRFLFKDKVATDEFFGSIGRKTVDARKVDDVGRGNVKLVASAPKERGLYLAVLAVHSDTREVADVLVGAGELIKERGLAAVLLSCKGKGERGALGKRTLGIVVVVFARLTQARVE